MRTWLRAVGFVMVVLGTRQALAQVVDPAIFGNGKPPLYKTEEIDRRFLKTGIYGALNQPPKSLACQRVVGTLLVAYADAIPYLHRKDQSFYVDPALLRTLRRTIVTKGFPAVNYLQAMIRRTMILHRVPAAWIATAKKLKASLQAPIDTARMRLDAHSVHLIDSFIFNMPALLSRYRRQVTLAPSVAVGSAEDRFRDKYMDRDIAWGGLVLDDIAKQAPPKPRRHRRRHHQAPPPPEGAEPTWAIVGYPVGRPMPLVPGIPGSGRVPQVKIRARLAPDQVMNLDKFERGERVLVKGHLWDMGKNMSFLEVHHAYLLADPDWRTWRGMASWRDVQNCNIAVDDLSPYGYTPRTKLGPAPNPYIHNQE